MYSLRFGHPKRADTRVQQHISAGGVWVLRPSLVMVLGNSIFFFFLGALESDMRGYCEKCWALVLLPRKRWLHEHHRVCSLLSTHIFQLPSYSESKGTSAYKRPPCDGVTCTTSWIFSLAPSPRMTFAHPPGEGERAKADLQSYWFLSAYKYQRIRPRGRPRCVTPSKFHTRVCMYDRLSSSLS